MNLENIFAFKKYRALVGLAAVLCLSQQPVFGQLVGTPSPSSPANGSTNQPLVLQLAWGASSGASSYELQVSTDGSFSSTVFDQSNISGTSQSVGPLANGTTYYWRVRGEFLTVTSAWSDVWSFETVPSPPPAPLLSQPLNNSQNQPTTVTFTWGSAANASGYRFQVADDSAFSSTVSDQTLGAVTTASVAGLTTGTKYFWRLSASNAGGTSGWSSVWAFSTIPQIPAAPALSGPSNNSLGQPTTETFSWNSVANATGYRFQLSVDSAFSTTVSDQTLSATTSVPVTGLTAGTKYFWRVNASNAGGASGWSNVWNFTTVVPLPASPALLSPSNNSLNQPTSLTFAWNGVSNASGYRLQVSSDSAFSSSISDQSLGAVTTASVSGLTAGSKYFWRVSASNAGGSSGWSATWNFVTVPLPPAAPNPLQPTNNSSGQPTTITLQWSASQNAVSYNLEVSGDSAFSSTFLNQNVGNTTSDLVQGLTASQKYFWRVTAANSGGTSPWSAVWNFTTLTPLPSGPLLLSPSNNAANQPTNVTLSWNSSTYANSYRVQISTDSTFAATTIDNNTGTSTSDEVQGLLNSKIYFWRVNASNSAGSSPWSAVWRFGTTTNPLPPPVLVSPLNSSVDQPINVALTWKPVATAGTYQIQVWYKSDFSTLIANDSSLKDTVQQIGSLLKDTLVYWRVASVNNGGKSPWSSPWTFRTIPPQPSAPAPMNPPNGAAVESTTVVVSWTSPQNALSYTLQVSLDSLFGSTTYRDSTLTKNSQQISGLQRSSKYYWRVNAKNSGGTGPWSPENSFATAPSSSPGPSLVSPANDAVNQPLSPTLQWVGSQGTTYELQVSADPSFGSAVYDYSSITASSQQVGPMQYSTKYYWRVRSIVLLFTSDWSAVWDFTTMPKSPAAPLLVSPTNGATGLPINPLLVWRSSTSAVLYHLQISSRGDFSGLNLDDSILTDSSFQAGPLTPDSTYFWRVSASNGGGSSGWSSISNFTTAQLQTPVLANPPDGTTIDSTMVFFVWNQVNGASGYWLQVSADSSFANSYYSDSLLTKTSQEVTGLQQNINYYWRVRALNLGSRSAWSQPRSFKTQPPGTFAGPILVSPQNNSSEQPTTLTLTWIADSTASSYELELAQNQAFDTTTYDNSSITKAAQQINQLVEGATYYWRVRSFRNLISSSWSQVWKLTTTNSGVILPPTLLSPLNGTQDIPLAPVLRWSLPSNGIESQLQIATDSSYTTIVFNDSTITVDSAGVASLRNGTYYAWHVRIGTSSGWSPYSSSWIFKTTSNGTPGATTDSALNVTATSALLNASVNPDGFPTTVRFVYGTSSSGGDSVNATPSLITAAGVTNISAKIDSLSPNTTYHYHVIAANSAGLTQGQDMIFTTSLPVYPQTINISPNVYFPAYASQSLYKATDYRIVGLPGASNIRVDSLLAGQYNVDWDVYWDNGVGSDTLIAFDHGQNFTFSCGRAFWLIKKGPWNPALSVTTAPLDSLNNVRLPLHAGWNLITNPFLSGIQWSSIQSVNGSSDPIYSFNGSFNISQQLDTYSGYYYFNSSAAPYLKIPYTSLFSPQVISKQSATAHLPGESSGWKIQISLTSEGITDRTMWLGVSEQSIESIMAMNFHKPAKFSDVPAVYFDRPEWNQTYPTFASDIRAPFDNEQTWKFAAWCPGRKPAILNFSGVGLIPSNFEAYLIDVAGGRAVNLRTDSTYSYSPGLKNSEFMIAIGVKDSVDKVIESVEVPHAFALGVNYPNPFNPQTTIPIEIPLRSTIQLEIYNILGQKVRSLYSGSIEPGRYWFQWDGKNEQGNYVSTGVYIYRLGTASKFASAKRMILLK